MKYRTYPPPASLSDYVKFFWVLESEILHQPYIYRSMADSCTELLFHYKGTFDELTSNGDQTLSFMSGIHSQTDQYRRFVTKEEFGIFGVYLYPYASKQLLNLSPPELTNQMPDLISALGNRGKELEEKIMLAPDNFVRISILTQFFENRLLSLQTEEHPARSAVKYLIQSKNLHPVHELADIFNLSERQFERKFREYSGLSPKLCMRIIRFEEACRKYGNNEHHSLAGIAHECGYYDQSHFIRDFKEFSGYEPGRYFAGQAEGIEWREEESVLNE